MQLQSGSAYSTLSFTRLSRTLSGTKLGSTVHRKRKENNGAEREGSLYASLPPPFCQKKGKWKQRK